MSVLSTIALATVGIVLTTAGVVSAHEDMVVIQGIAIHANSVMIILFSMLFSPKN
jgi:hypothetical protein